MQSEKFRFRKDPNWQLDGRSADRRRRRTDRPRAARAEPIWLLRDSGARGACVRLVNCVDDFACRVRGSRCLAETAEIRGVDRTVGRNLSAQLNRVRSELTQLCGLDDLPGLEIIFGASGTDLHLFAFDLTRGPAPLVIRVETAETGSGVPDALGGRHFSDCAALGDGVIASTPLEHGRAVDLLEVKCRSADGELRSKVAIDAEVEAAVSRAAAARRHILLTMVDVSKTGILAPSPACVVALRRRFPKSIEVLVDACQFRLAPSTLRAYLDHDFLVAITGSKFATGPAFCGALLVPPAAASRLRGRSLSHAMSSYSARTDWPRNWAAQSALKPVANYGLLLRWQAALTELRAFRRLPEPAVADFLHGFAGAVTHRLADDPAFELLPVPAPLAIRSRRQGIGTPFRRFFRSCSCGYRPMEGGIG